MASLLLARPQRAPSKIPVYLGTQTTTVNEDTTTWDDVDIGVPHPRRLIVLAGTTGVAAAATGTVQGISQFQTSQNAAHEFALLSFQVPHGTRARVTFTATSSIRKAISVYAIYPESPFMVSSDQGSAGTTTPAAANNIVGRVGGCVIWAGGNLGAASATSTQTWGGIDPVVENLDTPVESAGVTATGHVAITAGSTSTLSLASSVSATKRVTAASWGAARGYDGRA